MAGGNGEIYSPPTNSTALLAREECSHNGYGGGVAYVDVGLRDGKRHTVLLRHDGWEEVKRLNSLLDLLGLDVKTVFIDSLMLRIIPELKALVEHGVRVFHLRNLKLLRATREANNMEKSDENDAKILSMVPPEEFRECTLDYLRLRELLVKYHKLKKRIMRVRQWDKEVPVAGSREYIQGCEGEIEKIECEAHEIATRTLPLYVEVLRLTGLDKSIDVVGLLCLLDTSRGFEKLRRYTGLFSVRRVTRTGKIYIVKPKKYSHRARMFLHSISEHIIGVEIAHQRYGKHVDERVWCQVYRENRRLKKKVALKIQTILLRYIRRLSRAQEAQAAGRA